VQHVTRTVRSGLINPVEGAGEVYDSAQPQQIPSHARSVAGYVTGSYAWSRREWERFHGRHITIDAIGGDVHADVEDVEGGAVPYWDLRPWAKARIRMGYVPVIYSSVSVHSLFLVHLMRGIRYQWWAASPTDKLHRLPGSVATQWDWASGYDVSETK
jgi:hypothetical protein